MDEPVYPGLPDQLAEARAGVKREVTLRDARRLAENDLMQVDTPTMRAALKVALATLTRVSEACAQPVSLMFMGSGKVLIETQIAGTDVGWPLPGRVALEVKGEAIERLRLLSLPFEPLPEEPVRIEAVLGRGDDSLEIVVLAYEYDKVRELLLAERLRSASFEAALLAWKSAEEYARTYSHLEDAKEDCAKSWQHACTVRDAALAEWSSRNATAQAGSEPRVPSPVFPKPSGPAAAAPDPADFECDVCGNRPNENGELEHGKGCYVMSEDGGGVEVTDYRAPRQ